ncbi:FAD-dependent monooxygenase [Archangium primigenium]|uniref:FAD-dependent monooxygenase n=1 Tax=[Archangium] primigenium TaxID=2792470 RepID=UPI001955FC67|nr:FAD-dependent monooxygenase [Archangium primigenium]MBM7116843.1 FAD-dependent monooxygenase [Archangium primigenium]
MRSEVDVAVVGGGPVGWMVACELALGGVRVSVHERRTERVSQSRALTLHPRSLEILALRGLADRFLARGRPLPLGHYAQLDTRLDFSPLDTAFPYTLFIPQSQTEALLEERARELGVDIQRGCRVTDLREDAEGVDLEGTREGGDTFQVRARYVVGADGARSAVRTLAGIAFPGTPATRSMMLGDVVLATPPATPGWSTVTAAGGMMLAPLGDGLHHRLVVNDPRRAGAPLSEPVTLEELAGSVRAIADTDFGMHSPRWLSRFGDETRLAATYRAGRVFLAGDAAHIHLPAGGQGLNVGLQDAMNLGWKLAGVLRGRAPDALLDSYHRERHGVGARLLRNTLSQTALLSDFGPAGLALREAVSGLLTLPEANRRLAEQIAAFDVAYAGSFLPAPPGVEGTGGLVGRRLPELTLRGPRGEVRSLYALMHEGRWLVLQRESTAPRPALSSAWADWTTVVTADVPERAGEWGTWSSLWVRPDGHVGYVDRGRG